MEEVSVPTTRIPTIHFEAEEQEDEPQQPPVVRSQSFEIPRSKPQGIHAHFDTTTSELRPGINRASISHSEGYGLRRPSVQSRRSFATSVSSFSLYSNFAGERFQHKKKKGKKHTTDHIDIEKARDKKQQHRSSQSSDESSMEDDVSSKSIDEEDEKPKATVGKAMLMFLKAFIGSGVLFIPKAFEHGGLALSIVLMILIAFICWFAFLRLVNTQLVIGGSYGDIGGVLFGRYVRFIVLFFIVLSQLAFVCAYFIFVSGNLVSVVDVLSNCTAGVDQKYYVWIPLIILIPLALIRHIARLSFTAIIADVFILFGLVVTLYFTASQLATAGIGPNIAAVNPVNFALMIGTATFSFEGIGLIIPIVESMQRPEKFPFVLTLGMIIVCSIYILIGTIAYLAYGDTVQSAVIYNFPLDSKLTIVVKLLYSLAICLTAPLMLFPALKIIENGLFQKFKSGKESMGVKWSKNVYRVLLCILCAVVAFAIGGDNLDKFVSLVGSIACVPLCFIFPGMFHMKISRKRVDRVADSALILFGIGIMFYTLVVSIKTFINPLTESTALLAYCPISK